MEDSLLQQFDILVDGLAEHSYAVLDNFLSDKEVKALLAALIAEQEAGNLKKAGIGKGQEVINEVRGDFIHWLEADYPNDSVKAFYAKINELIAYLNRTCYLGLEGIEMHFAMYPAGSFYKRHLDCFKNTNRRKISMICYLNENWQSENGGELVIYLKDGNGSEYAEKILPVAGRIACFRSDLIEHEVLPGTRERKSITGWMLRPQIL